MTASPAAGRVLALLALLAGLIGAAPPAAAHDVPSDTRVRAFAKEEGEVLRVLVRVPLALLLNIDLPKRGPGYLDLAQIDGGLARATTATDDGIRWSADGRRLAPAGATARISLPSDRSFDSVEKAQALLAGPRLAESTYVFWNQGYFDAELVYPLGASQPTIAVDFRIAPGLRDRMKFDLRYITADGTIRAYELPTGGGPTILDPHWFQAAATFVASGFRHILEGADHLLFLLCLVLPFRRLDGALIGVVSAFTVGHSITLVAAAYGVAPGGAWFAPLVETLIAVSILYMAIENAVRSNLRRRWLVSAAFGLVHGFAFSFLLQEQLQFAGSHLLTSLLAFNVGIELGQCLVLLVIVPLLVGLRRLLTVPDRTVAIIVAALVGHTAWHWAVERADTLWQAEWPDVSTSAGTLASVMLVLVVVAVVATLRLRHPKLAALAKPKPMVPHDPSRQV